MSKDLPSWAAGLDRNVFTPAKPSYEVPEVVEEVVASAPVSDYAPAPQSRTRNSSRPTFAIRDPKARIEGTFETSDSIEIGCEMSGDIKCGQLVISETGNVRATVRAVDAVIEGRFEGDIVATGSIEVTATAVVSGSVQTNSFVVQRGARFTGSVQQLQEQRAQAPLIAIELPVQEPEVSNGSQQDEVVLKDENV